MTDPETGKRRMIHEQTTQRIVTAAAAVVAIVGVTICHIRIATVVAAVIIITATVLAIVGRSRVRRGRATVNRVK
jgi:Flp pilus assembly protein TadB